MTKADYWGNHDYDSSILGCLVARVVFEAGRAPMRWLWGYEGKSYLNYCGQKMRQDLPFFRIGGPDARPVMEWSYDGPVSYSQHRWILFGPFDSKEDAQDFVYSIPRALIRGWTVESVYSHVRKYALTSRAYTDG